MTKAYITIIFAVSFCILLVQLVRMARHWRRGSRYPTSIVQGALALPKRYLGDVHEVVARKPGNAHMHALTAGGFIATLMGTLLTLIGPFSGLFLTAVVAVSALVCVLGCVMDILRHARHEPGLSQARYQLFPLLLAISALSLAVLALLSIIAPLNHLMNFSIGLIALAALSCLAWWSGNGPMRHAVAGVTHLILHPRPERFGGGRSTGLKTIDFSKEPLGVVRMEEFLIPQLVSFDACVQCGRCEQVCPAFDAGQPLNPKRLINDLAASLRGHDQVHYAGVGYSHDTADTHTNFITSDSEQLIRVPKESIWACTTCRACVEACPMMIEHLDAIVDLRRGQTLRSGEIAPVAQQALENLKETDTQNGEGPQSRFDWAVDLNLPLIERGVQADVLLWVGESAFDRRIQKTLRSLILLLRHAGIEPHILAERELDCGDQARRLGDEELFQALAKRNIETLNGLSFTSIVTADPHVLHVLRNEYPALGGHYQVRHHTDVLSELIQQGKITPTKPVNLSVTYHDPCYLGRYNGEFEAPRQILASLGANIIEMKASRAQSHCCGGGGGAPLTDIKGERRIPDTRMQHVKTVGASCVAVACPGCTVMLEGVPNPLIEVRDVTELLYDAVEV